MIKTMRRVSLGICLLIGVFGVSGEVCHAQATDSDTAFLTTVSQAGVNEIKLSQLAEAKATDPAVKKFAEKMISDHMMLAEKFKPFAAKRGIVAPSDLDEEHKELYAKLNDLSGPAFDKEYMDAMVADHKAAFDLFLNEVSSAKDMKLKKAVVKAQPVIADHKDMAIALDKKLL